MAAFQTVWSIDVGKSSLKAVKVQRERNSLEILAVDKVDYPVETTGFNALQHAKEALQTFTQRNEINCAVVAAHPGHSAFSRFIELPPVDPKKLDEMVGYEAQQQIPFPIDEVVWDYHICDGGDAPEKTVGIFAVRREVVSDFMVDYEAVGLSLDVISIGYLGLLNYVQFDLRPQKPSVVVDIGSDHTDLLIVDGAKFWVRNLPIAGNDITQALMEKFKLQFDEAEKLKVNANKSEHAVKIFSVIQPVLKELVNEIHRSVGFYKSQAGEVKFEDVYLFGNTAKVLGIQKFLQEQLRFRVHVARKFNRIRINREANVALLQQDFSSFVAAVGNAIQALGAGTAEVNLMPKEQQEAQQFKRKQRMVLLAAAALFVVPLYWWVLFHQKTGAAERALLGTAVTTELDGYKKQIEAADRQRSELDAKWHTLRAELAHRALPAEAFRLVHEVFNAIPGEQVVEVEPFSETQLEARRPDLLADMERLNEGKIWLVSFETELVVRDATGKIHALRDKLENVPEPRLAYRCSIHGMATVRPEAVENQTQVARNVQEPLEQRLRERYGEPSAEHGNWVKGVAVTGIPNSLYREPDTFREVRAGGREAVEQGTFYPFAFEFTLVASPSQQ